MPGPEDDPLPEAVALVEGAARAGLRLRLLGGLGVRVLCPDFPPRLRAGQDMDLACGSKGRRDVVAYLEKSGCVPDKAFNSLNGDRQMYFTAPSGRPVDVMVDRLVMCHTLDFRPSFGNSSLTLDPADLLLSKLQIFELNAKDARDITHLLSGVPAGERAPGDGGPFISTGRFGEVLAGDWGWWRTTTGNLEKLPALLAESPEMIPPRPRFDALEQAARLLDVAKSVPKSMKWKLRSNVGDRVRWYELPEEVAHLSPPEAPRGPAKTAARPQRSHPDNWQESRPLMKMFFATDIHGSEICWKKFLNAAAFYKADLVVLGGDVTGKVMVPIVAYPGYWEVTFRGERMRLDSREELLKVDQQLRDRGSYPAIVTSEELDQLSSQDAIDQRFNVEMTRSLDRWLDMADGKLRGGAIPCILNGGNDDIFEIDPILESAPSVTFAEGKVVDLAGSGFTMISMGYTNPTPWDTHREAPEEELTARIDAIAAQVPDMSRTVFNFHAPPYGTGLDEAPELDASMRPTHGGAVMKPVGSTAVRDAILKYQPPLSVHGHIHESRGVAKLGRTRTVNPGSSYGDGVLQAALIDINPKNGKVKYVLVNG